MKVTILGKNGLKTVDLNRRKAIRERCLNCSGWYHKEVTNCTFTDCPLYPFRAGQGKQNAKHRSKKIREYCLWCMNGQHGELSKCTSIDCSLFAYRQTKTDKSAEIKSLPIKRHIELFPEDKTKAESTNIEGITPKLKKPAHGANEQALRVLEMQNKHNRLSRLEQSQPLFDSLVTTKGAWFSAEGALNEYSY